MRALPLLLPTAAIAATTVLPWGGSREAGPVPPAFQAWHDEFEGDGDYGESWFFIAWGDDGGVLYALVSVTNLGLHTFDGSIDVQYYPPGGGAHRFHREVRRDAVSGARDRMEVRVGGAHAWGGGDRYHLEVEEEGLRLRLDLDNELPSVRIGDGRVRFGGAGDEWTLGINAPRARARGLVEIDGASFRIEGTGYHDHGWATLKLPDFLERWTSVRLYADDLTLVLHDHAYTARYGGGHDRFGVVGLDGRVAGVPTDFELRASEPREVAGRSMPTRIELDVRAGDVRVRGTVTERRFLDAVDVLGALSLPVRVAIKTFYSNPYMLRSIGRADLVVEGPDGSSRRVVADALVEVDTY